MTRINIDLLYKMAEDFEEAIPPSPPTLPAGLSPPTKDVPIAKVEVEESPSTVRFLFEKDMKVGTLKELMIMLSDVFDLSRGAATVIKSMSKNTILDPTSGIYTYLKSMNEQMDKINSLIGYTKYR